MRIGLLVFLSLWWALLATLPPMALGQLPVASPETPAVSGADSAESPEKAMERLTEALTKARQSLKSAQTVFESTPPEQLGATEEETIEKLHLLLTRVLLYEQHIEYNRKLLETRKASEDLGAKIDGWTGFGEPPPYPVSLVDELRDTIYAQKLAISKDGIRLPLVQQDQEEAREALKTSEQKLRKVKESLETPAEGTEQIRNNWLYGLAQLENEVAGARAIATQTLLQTIEESQAFHKKQQTFLERQLHVAAADAPFTREELDQKLAAIEKKQKDLEKDQRQVTRDDRRNQEKLHHARIGLQKARETLGQQEAEAEKTNEEISRLEGVVEARKAQADTSAQQIEVLKLWSFALNAQKLLWEERHRLANNPEEADLKQVEEDLKKRLEKIAEYNSYFESNLKLAQNLVMNEQQRLATGTLSPREQALAQQKLEAFKNRADFNARVLADMNDLARLLDRFKEEIKDRRQQITLGERLRVYFDRTPDFASAIWNYELFAVEDTVVVNGQPVTERRPVTISKVVRALLILVIGLWLTYRLKHRLSGLAERLFNLEAAAALLVEKFFQTVTIFCLLVFALVTVKIPLTVFAFMGGALAIGVGFGAQALINNFISGIILLFERPIKVGDMVEVEGTRGRVTSIGMRCSEIRRFDGVDILVPNSAFLEKNVVNWTLSDQLIRLEVKVGVAYGSQTREVSKVIAHALEVHGKILKDPEPVILFEDFGDSALIFSVHFWVEVLRSQDYRIIASDFRHLLDKRFREAGIIIAFPQMDIHLDSSQPVRLQMVDVQDKE